MKYKVNDIIKGKITGIESYGVFVAIDKEYSGLIHISEISNSFVKNINDYVSLGEEINAKVIEVNEKEKHLKLSIKDLNYNNDEIQFIAAKKGFNSLKENLKPWMDEKLAEIKEQ